MNTIQSIGFCSEESFIGIASDAIRDSKKQYLLISLELDNFNAVTLSYGYQTGNVLLHDLVFFFQMLAHDDFLSCRRDTNHFLFLLEISGLEAALLHSQLEKQYDNFIAYAHREYPLSRVDYHAGMIRITKEHMKEAIYKADFAKNSILSSPTHHIVFFDEIMVHNMIMEQQLLSLFDYIAEENRILLYLQPKFNLQTKQLIGAEVFVRIRDIFGSVIEPATFLPILRKHGLLYQLDLMVLERIMQLLSEWIMQGIEPVPISINLSKHDFYAPEFEKIVAEMLEKYEIPQKFLEFEITEACLKEEFEFISERINRLHGKGYTFSIDHFGQNEISLVHIGLLPVDIVKLDCNLIRQNMRTIKGRKIIAKLVEMFSDIGIQTICEGIETEEEALILRRCGCMHVQGQLYDKPLPVSFFCKKYMDYRNNEMLLY